MSAPQHHETSVELSGKAVDQLLQAVSKTKSSDANEFIKALEDKKAEWKTHQPWRTCMANMADRAIKFVHEAYKDCEENPNVKPLKKEGDSESDSEEVQGHLSEIYAEHVFSRQYRELRKMVLQKLVELKDDLKVALSNICAQAAEHIHADEIVITSGFSSTVLEFCKSVGPGFHIVVAECEPIDAAHAMALALAEANIDTTLMPESNVNALMTRAAKVLISADMVTADGGIVAPGGAFNLCLSAKMNSVPVLVCAGMYKFSPRILCSYDLDSFNHMGSAATIAEYSDGAIVKHAQITHPLYDFVPSDLVSMFLTNSETSVCVDPKNIYHTANNLYVDIES